MTELPENDHTPLEDEGGDTLDQRLAQEVPEEDPYEAAADETENLGGGVGEDGAGGLVGVDESLLADLEKDLDEDLGDVDV